MTDVALERSTGVVSAKTRPRRGYKGQALFALALAAGLGGAWYGYGWWTTGRFIETTDDAYIGGNITAISPHVAGFISEILVTDNQHVSAGQLVIRLDERDVRAAADHAQATLRGRNATLAGLQAKYVMQQSAIRQASADLDAKTAQASFSGKDAARYRSVALTGAGSRQDAERAISVDQQAQSAIMAAQAGLEAARQQVTVLAADITEADAAVGQAQADLRTARLNLGYTEIRSPIDGYIGNRAAQVGAYVSEGAYLLTIIPARGLWVDANFKEDQLAQMTPGQPATVVADVAPGHVFHWHVLSLAPGTGAIFSVIPPENATGNFTKIVQRVPVRIALDDGDATLGRIRPGLSTLASVDIRPEGGRAP
jgi:membrane fusion protein, multidrug efflux system